MSFEDILYEIRNGVAWITINRPEKMNAFRGTTCDELIKALYKAGYDKSVGAIVLAGAGDRAFCTGGDQSAHDGNYDGRGTIGLPMEELHTAIRDVPKPVIARVQGYAIGGGNVLATICDLTICSDKAVFGQVGPKMGSVDPGYGTAFLARVVGEKKAREMWYLCRRYSGPEAVAMGLGVGHLRVVDREPQRAAALAAALVAVHGRGRATAAAEPALTAAHLQDATGLIHATPTGMAQHPGIALDPSLLHAGLWVSEVVYSPIETDLLRAARERGCRVADGGGMAVGQAVGAFRLFTGLEPDAARMEADFRELLAERGD